MTAEAPALGLSVPAYLRRLADALDEIDSSAERLLDGLADRQFQWQPRSGAWSIAQCLDHLAAANTLYAIAIRQAVDEARRLRFPEPSAELKPGLLSRFFLWCMEPPPKFHLRAPERLAPPANSSRDASWPAFLAAEARIRNLILECADLNVNRARFINPFAQSFRFTLGDGLSIVLAHSRRHIWQAQQVRIAPGFPV
jgi:hypothetical protein